MKKLLLALSLPLLSFIIACEETHEPENKDLLATDLVNNPRTATGLDSTAVLQLPTMDFRDTVRDFGTIKQGEVVTVTYEFTNNGKAPLIISKAAGSCGCTVADYPKEPLAPGRSSSVEVQFSSAGKEGHQEKSITLTTNSNRGAHFLYIRGEIVK